jgi:hypothetical protein
MTLGAREVQSQSFLRSRVVDPNDPTSAVFCPVYRASMFIHLPSRNPSNAWAGDHPV